MYINRTLVNPGFFHSSCRVISTSISCPFHCVSFRFDSSPFASCRLIYVAFIHELVRSSTFLSFHFISFRLIYFIHFISFHFIHSFIHAFIHSFHSVHPFTHSCVHSFVHSFIDSFIHSIVIDSLSFIHCHLTSHSFMLHSFIHSFIRSCMHALIYPFFLSSMSFHSMHQSINSCLSLHVAYSIRSYAASLCIAHMAVHSIPSQFVSFHVRFPSFCAWMLRICRQASCLRC